MLKFVETIVNRPQIIHRWKEESVKNMNMLF